MKSTLKTNHVVLALVLSACLTTTTQAGGFISKAVIFIAGAIVGGPYLQRTLCAPTKQYDNWSSLHQHAWPEVGHNIVHTWNNTKSGLHYLHILAQQYEK